jgi:hypothetical protein
MNDSASRLPRIARKIAYVLTFAAALAANACVFGAAAAEQVSDAGVYSRPDAWLCRPGRADACAANQDATLVAADGALTFEAFHPDPASPIDCFYVYPTVSHDLGGNSDLTAGPEERRAAQQQFARFGAKCRLFAPIYRQVTPAALRTAGGAHPIASDPDLGDRDIAAAWRDYLARDNHGRGFVLIGHSQGAGVLTRLIQREIDGKPIAAQLVSAILMGTSLPVPKGADIGGAFKHIPVCRAEDQTGCVIAFSEFRADAPPPAGSLFVHAPEGMQAACANPAALGGGAGALDAYLSTTSATIVSDAGPRRAWTHPPQPIRTPFVKVPGLLSAECVANRHGAYLAVTMHPTPGGARVNDISGDLILNGKAASEWGLHLIDANLAMGNLLDIVGEETKAYLARARK